MNPNLEKDLFGSSLICEKCKTSKVYSQNLYAALCNNRFFYGNDEWTCSWRTSGDIVADIRDCGEEYMDWYCSGIASEYDYIGNKTGFVSEGEVTDEIKLDLIKLGWVVKPYPPKHSQST